jgi:hypothetical protein
LPVAALLLPAFEAADIRNATLGPLYTGTVAFGFIVGLALWLKPRRSSAEHGRH